MKKLPRPKILGGIIIKTTTGCGNMYVQLGWCNGKLFEVFATLGKAGGCAMCFNESLTRTITTGLRCGVSVSEYIEQLRGTMCPTPKPFPIEDRVLSCPDAIGKVLDSYGLLTTEGMIKLVRELDGEPDQSSSGQLSEASQLSEEEEKAQAIKHMEELKAEREKLEARER